MKPIYFFLLMLSVLVSCSRSPLKIKQITTGSSFKDANATGSLSYTFKSKESLKSYKDMCNYIYFEGDTLTFSIMLNKDLKNETIHIDFILPDNPVPMKAERIEKSGDTIKGFSLIGSLLEHNYKKSLNQSLKMSEFNNKSISFSIVITLLTSTGEIKETNKGSFSLLFN